MSMFAADLDEVILQKGKRPIYEDPAKFFALTYPTYNLRNLARDVVRRLAGMSDKAVRQLNLTYGGGKTHTLITLFHLVNDPAALPDLPAVEEFRTHIDLGKSLPKARVAAISFDKLDLVTGMEVADPTGKIARLFHPWSLLAWQLAGTKGLEILNGGKGMAERETAPAENVMIEVLGIPHAEGVSSLILLDEVLMFARQKVAGDKGWLIKLQSFFQSLTQAAVKTDRCAVVASLLASDIAANDSLGLDIVTALKEILKRQEEEMVEPVVKEDVAEVLRRRLFKPCDPADMRTNAITAFKGVCAHDEALKREGASAEKTFVESYPFHPYLTNILYSNWTGLPRFQRTRGVLRLGDVKKLTEGASGLGVRTHTLPDKPSDIEDDGKFHFAVLGPEAASESGKPSAVAKRFIDETTSAAKPRVYRNAVILAVPSKDGLDMMRSRIADLLAWEQVALELNDKAKN